MQRALTPIQTLLLGFIVLTLLGGVLLWFPVSAAGTETTSPIDALFIAASAISTTGLITVDTGSHFSMFGQTVILILIQIGGLGYMIFITLLTLGIRAQFTISGRLMLTESIARPKTVEAGKFVKAVLLITAFFELGGTLLLTAAFFQRMPFGEAVYSAMFHSISAFCTAGFSLYADSFVSYADAPLANIIIAVVTIAGGIGFFVLYDALIFFRRKIRRQYPFSLSDHTKMVLVASLLLMATGTIALFLIDSGESRSLGSRLLTASFQAISASTTTGFNSVDIGKIPTLGLVHIIILMFIGASPGSTGGGIKTTSFGIILLFLRSVITNREDVTAFRRTIAASTVRRALGIALIGACTIMVVVLVLSISEDFAFKQILFETTSALGTVGLSMGITPLLSIPGKFVIIATMLAGRVGPLAIGYSLVGRAEKKRYSYPNGNVMVG